ncbi:MAG: response regulator, partial [Marinicella sp.]
MDSVDAVQEILLVDDDTSLAELLNDYLSGFGFRLHAVTNAVDCMRYLRRQVPDTVVLDVMLPGKDGLEICQDIRKEFKVPILMLSARGELTDKVLGLELGADDYLA